MTTVEKIGYEIDNFLESIEGCSILKINGGAIVYLKEMDKAIGYDLTEYDTEVGEIMFFDIDGIEELGIYGMGANIERNLDGAKDVTEVINYFKSIL